MTVPLKILNLNNVAYQRPYCFFNFYFKDSILNVIESLLSAYEYDNLLARLDKFEYICFDFQPSGILELANGNILVCSWLNNLMVLYDSNFNQICRMLRVNDQVIWPSGLASDPNGNVFVTDVLHNSINKLNVDLGFIKAYRIPDDSVLRTIAIYKERLYACLLLKKRIDIMSLDFQQISSHSVDIMPVEIKIMSDDVACIVGQDKAGLMETRFYKMPSFDLIIRHNKVGFHYFCILISILTRL
jgi:hypothetical protein